MLADNPSPSSRTSAENNGWAWAAAAGAVAVAAGGIMWASFRRSAGPPRAEALAAVPPSEPIILPQEDLPQSGPKARSYPGTSGPKLAVDTQLEAGPGYAVRSPAKAWGTKSTIAAIKGAAQRWVEQSPEFALDGVTLRIADISKRGGGTLARHKSHHEGRDVDLTLQGVEGQKLPAVALPLLLRVLLEDPEVQVVFLDWNRQAQVWNALDVNPELDGRVLAELQYPRAPHSGRMRVRHWPGHRNHVHVRFRS